VLAALDQVAAEHNATPAEIAIAWLVAQPGVTAPIASATTLTQLDSLVRGVKLNLTGDQQQVLEQAGQ
jgi:aryl-alcohol dehydrogenase-like predicted oxidoreductase